MGAPLSRDTGYWIELCMEGYSATPEIIRCLDKVEVSRREGSLETCSLQFSVPMTPAGEPASWHTHFAMGNDMTVILGFGGDTNAFGPYRIVRHAMAFKDMGLVQLKVGLETKGRTMQLERTERNWQGMSMNDIVREIASDWEMGFSLNTLGDSFTFDDSTLPLIQTGQSDFHFLRELCDKNGLRFDILQNTIVVTPFLTNVAEDQQVPLGDIYAYGRPPYNLVEFAPTEEDRTPSRSTPRRTSNRRGLRYPSSYTPTWRQDVQNSNLSYMAEQLETYREKELTPVQESIVLAMTIPHQGWEIWTESKLVDTREQVWDGDAGTVSTESSSQIIDGTLEDGAPLLGFPQAGASSGVGGVSFGQLMNDIGTDFSAMSSASGLSSTSSGGWEGPAGAPWYTYADTASAVLIGDGDLPGDVAYAEVPLQEAGSMSEWIAQMESAFSGLDNFDARDLMALWAISLSYQRYNTSGYQTVSGMTSNDSDRMKAVQDYLAQIFAHLPMSNLGVRAAQSVNRNRQRATLEATANAAHSVSGQTTQRSSVIASCKVVNPRLDVSPGDPLYLVGVGERYSGQWFFSGYAYKWVRGGLMSGAYDLVRYGGALDQDATGARLARHQRAIQVIEGFVAEHGLVLPDNLTGNPHDTRLSRRVPGLVSEGAGGTTSVTVDVLPAYEWNMSTGQWDLRSQDEWGTLSNSTIESGTAAYLASDANAGSVSPIDGATDMSVSDDEIVSAGTTMSYDIEGCSVSWGGAEDRYGPDGEAIP